MEIVLFLFMVAFISLSGVMMPGPVFAAAIVKGAKDKHAGAWIAAGHLVVEVPLILAIAAGFHYLLKADEVKMGIGLAGGASLIYMGTRMFMMREDTKAMDEAFPTHAFFAGVITTISNPYLFLWWATVGAALILAALEFGAIGLVLFIIVHEACDLVWEYFVAYTTYRSRKFWTKRTHILVFGGCGLLLSVFGVYFVLSVVPIW